MQILVFLLTYLPHNLVFRFKTLKYFVIYFFIFEQLLTILTILWRAEIVQVDVAVD